MSNCETNVLAPYAAQDATSRGRVHDEPRASNRSEYQRDRDRVLHSAAFRRLGYKTQVFMNHEGDLFRTRLTHSMEVAQLSRTVARSLMLNEDLAETIALAHDLGHTPFGHAGQDALHECMKQFGGFEHNLQSLRIVEHLEDRYADFKGLNLTYESREGILKHCSMENAKLMGDVGLRFLEGTKPSLEAQLTNLADEIAYNNHDIDDGIRSGLITLEQMREVELFGRHARAVELRRPGLASRVLLAETIRSMINEMVADLTDVSRSNILESGVKSIEDVRKTRELIRFSDKMRQDSSELKRYLHKNLYKHYSVRRMRFKGQKVIKELFATFMTDPELLEPEYCLGDKGADQAAQARLVADYIAGMTDRYAYKEYKRLFQIEEE